MTSYQQKLRDPRWQKKRLEILSRDKFMCQKCEATDKTLHVHHGYYEPGKQPWDYENDTLQTVCEDCHEEVGKTTADVHRLIAQYGVYHIDRLRTVLEIMKKIGSIDTPRWPETLNLTRQQSTEIRQQLGDDLTKNLKYLGVFDLKCDAKKI